MHMGKNISYKVHKYIDLSKWQPSQCNCMSTTKAAHVIDDQQE